MILYPSETGKKLVSSLETAYIGCFFKWGIDLRHRGLKPYSLLHLQFQLEFSVCSNYLERKLKVSLLLSSLH